MMIRKEEGISVVNRGISRI